MKYTLTIVLCVLVSVLTSQFFAQRNETRSQVKYNTVIKEKEKIDYQSSKFKNLFITHLKYEDSQINLAKLNPYLLNSDTVVVFRFFEENCKDCIEKHFKAINALRSDKIVLVSNYDSGRQILLLKEKCKINTEIHLVKELHKEEDTSYPYFFSIKNGRISNIYIPNEDDSTTTVKYLQKVLDL